LSFEKSSLEKVYENYVSKGKVRFFIENANIKNATLNSTVDLYALGNIAFASSDIFLRTIHDWVDYNLLSILYSGLPLTFWLLTKQIELDLSNNREIRGVLYKYNELKNITRLINSIWATLVLSIIIQYTFRIIRLHEYAQRENIVVMANLCCEITFLVVGVVLMAEGCRFVSVSFILFTFFKSIDFRVFCFEFRTLTSKLGYWIGNARKDYLAAIKN